MATVTYFKRQIRFIPSCHPVRAATSKFRNIPLSGTDTLPCIRRPSDQALHPDRVPTLSSCLGRFSRGGIWTCKVTEWDPGNPSPPDRAALAYMTKKVILTTPASNAQSTKYQAPSLDAPCTTISVHGTSLLALPGEGSSSHAPVLLFTGGNGPALPRLD